MVEVDWTAPDGVGGDKRVIASSVGFQIFDLILINATIRAFMEFISFTDFPVIEMWGFRQDFGVFIQNGVTGFMLVFFCRRCCQQILFLARHANRIMFHREK